MPATSIQSPFPIFTDIDGQPLEQGQVWLGTAGNNPISSPITAYWDAALTQVVTQPVTTRGGYPLNGTAVGRLYVNADFSILVRNRRGYDVLSALSATERFDSSLVTFVQAGLGAVVRTAQAKMRDIVSVKDFGAVGDGVADDRAACQAAIDAVRAAGGGVVYFPLGIYLLTSVAGGDSTNNGLLVPYSSANDATNRVLLVGSGASTILKANSNSMHIVRYSDSHGGVENMTLDANGKTGVIGLGVVPENTTQTSTLVFQNYNVFRNLYIAGCTEGVTLRCGPDVGGADSGCWYNEFYSLKLYSCTRGIWLQNGPNASSSGVNRNKFFGGRVGQSGTNTGLQIDSGDTNEFHDTSFEGIQSGTSPNTTPTAIKIAASGIYSGDNNSNRFFGGTCEANSRDLENANSYTEMYGLQAGTNNLFTANPLVMFGGYDSSVVPQIYPSQLYQSNGQIAGYENNLNYFLSSRGFKTNGIWVARKTQGTGPGGGPTDFDFEFAYQAGAVYLVSRGGYDSAGTVYGHRVSVFFETSSGTFVEGTKIVDSVSASTSFITDTVTRSGAFVRVSVNVNKAATVFENYSTVIRLA